MMMTHKKIRFKTGSRAFTQQDVARRIKFVLLTSVTLMLFSAYCQAMPAHIPAPGEKVIIVNPREHAFGAYSADGRLLRSGVATAGANWCPDIGRSCRTRSGSFRIFSLGGSGCRSSKYPRPHGGAPMPYCMFFNGHQGLHGSYQVVRGNVSHGCVRVHVPDAHWLRFNFVNGPNASNNYRGTRIIIKPY